jgi:Xaa-Pro dipeptidase
MEKLGLDALIASTPTNVTYLSNFRAMSHENLGAFIFAVFPREKNLEPFLVIPSGEFADLIALKMTWFSDVRIYGSFYVNFPNNELEGWESSLARKLKSNPTSDPFVVLKNALEEKGLLTKHLGVDERGFRGEDYQRFLKSTGIEKFTNSFDVFREIRKIKNEDEIGVIKEANEITEKGIKATLESVRVGSSGSDLVRVFSETVARKGMTNFLPSISLGKDSYLQHNYFPSNRKLERGDLIRFDVACQYKYHFTDIGRNAVLGSASDRKSVV